MKTMFVDVKKAHTYSKCDDPSAYTELPPEDAEEGKSAPNSKGGSMAYVEWPMVGKWSGEKSSEASATKWASLHQQS